MRAALILIAGGILGSANVWAGANCEHSASWQCGAHLGGAEQESQTGGGISTTGHSPDPGTTNPHLGTVDTGGPQSPVAVVPEKVKVPPQLVQGEPQLVPQPVQEPPLRPIEPMKEPPIVQGEPQLVPQPVQEPPLRPIEPMKEPPIVQGEPQLVSQPVQEPPLRQPQKVKEPPQLPQGQPQRVAAPMLATPHPTDVHTGPATPTQPPSGTVPGAGGSVATGGRTPAGGTSSQGGTTVAGKPKPQVHKTVDLPHNPIATTAAPHVVATAGKPTPVVTGSQVAEGHTHYLVPTAPNTQLPHGIGASVWLDEVIEPGIENHKVELYRSNDAQEVLYKDAIPMDKTGFHLKVVGTRPPNYH